MEERPYGCAQCDKRFRYPKDVRRHMKIHGDEQFICPKCTECFTKDDNLQKHIISQHDASTAPGSFDGSLASSPGASVAVFSPLASVDTPPSNPTPSRSSSRKQLATSASQKLYRMPNTGERGCEWRAFIPSPHPMLRSCSDYS